MERVAGVLEVGRTEDTHEIVITHLSPTVDAQGMVRILFSPRHARHLANLLTENATYAEEEAVAASQLKVERSRSVDGKKGASHQR